MLRDQDLRTYGGRFKYPGVYRGIVEYINDPLEMHRVKVRVPTLHKTKDQISTPALPWAFIAAPFGGAGGFGSVWVPPVGSTVWVMFEHGDINNPIVIGAVYGIPAKAQEMGRVNALPKGIISMSSDENEPWKTTPGVELPEESQRRANMAPENYVEKTPKGHTIYMEDRDEVERLQVIDRAGQTILFEAEVLESENKGNKARRRLNNADDNDAIKRDKLLGSSARIEVIDAAGNRLRLYAKKGSEKISIISNVPDSDNRIQLDLNAADGQVDLRGTSSKGETRIGLDAVAGSAFLRASSGDELRVDSRGGVSIKSPMLAVDGTLQVAGDISSGGGSGSGAVPGSFAPTSMPTPAPPPVPPPAPPSSIELVISERAVLEDSADGVVFSFQRAAYFPATLLPHEIPTVLARRNGVELDYRIEAALFVDNEGQVWGTLGKPSSDTTDETTAANHDYGYSFDGSSCLVGISPDYDTFFIGDTGTGTGNQGPLTEDRPEDTVIVRGLGASSNLVLGAERANAVGGPLTDWVLVLRDATTLTGVSSSPAPFIRAWMEAHFATFGNGPVPTDFPIHLSADPDGSFWVSIPATPPDLMPLWNISGVTAEMMDLVVLAVTVQTARAKRLTASVDTEMWASPSSLHIVPPLREDEWLEYSYLTLGPPPQPQ